MLNVGVLGRHDELLRAEGDRVIAVVVDPIARPGLTIVAVARRNAVSIARYFAFTTMMPEDAGCSAVVGCPDMG